MFYHETFIRDHSSLLFVLTLDPLCKIRIFLYSSHATRITTPAQILSARSDQGENCPWDFPADRRLSNLIYCPLLSSDYIPNISDVFDENVCHEEIICSKKTNLIVDKTLSFEITVFRISRSSMKTHDTLSLSLSSFCMVLRSVKVRWSKNKMYLARHPDIKYRVFYLFFDRLTAWNPREKIESSLQERSSDQNANEIRGKTRHGLPGKFPTRRARVLFTDELPHVASVLLIRTVDYELRADVQYIRMLLQQSNHAEYWLFRRHAGCPEIGDVIGEVTRLTPGCTNIISTLSETCVHL